MVAEVVVSSQGIDAYIDDAVRAVVVEEVLRHVSCLGRSVAGQAVVEGAGLLEFRRMMEALKQLLQRKVVLKVLRTLPMGIGF